MLRTLLSLIFLVSSLFAHAQYFQQKIDYTIDAAYDKPSHTLAGNLKVRYTNNAPNPLDTIYLHLWANAFNSKSSPYTDQAIKLGKLDFYFANDRNMGGYESIEVVQENRSANLYYASDEIAYILPSKPLASGDSTELTIKYTLKLPYRFDRMGWKKDGVQLVHWYPSIAVYDQKGWHTMPYLMMGEHYPSIASYKVTLDLPYQTVGASGAIDGSDRTDNITDFVILGEDNATSETKEIEGVSVTFIHRDNATIQNHGFEYVEQALKYFNQQIGLYPHKSLTIVDTEHMGGMEYGGLVTLNVKDKKTLQYYLVHELLHQWFYGAIVTDQRKHGWIDEGFTTYYQQRYYAYMGKKDYYTEQALQNDHTIPLVQKLAQYQSCRHYAQSISTPVEKINMINYGLNSYEVPARWITHLANYIGVSSFDESIRDFYIKWKGKHPSPSDIKVHLETKSGKNLDWFFNDMLHGVWATDYAIKKAKNTVSVANKGSFAPPYALISDIDTVWYEGHSGEKKYPINAKSVLIGPQKGLIDRNPKNNTTQSKSLKLNLYTGKTLPSATQQNLYLAPLLNYNTSDGFKIGMALYNTITPKKFKFLVAPQYGFKSKRLVGTGWLSYDHYLDSPSFRKIFFKLSTKSYDDQYISSIDQPLRYIKVEPSISLHFRHAADSPAYSKLTLKPILLYNEAYNFTNKESEFKSSAIFQLRYEMYNFHALSPSDLMATLEYQPYTTTFGDSENYLKLTSAYKKAWHYTASKKISARLFASYFIANTKRNSSSYDRRFSRGATALIHQGFNDYTYEEYWFNRYNQDAPLSNQVSNLGGGFKTAFGSQYGIGQSNDLALAINLEGDLPIKLPKFLPLGLYFDLGYYTAKGTDSDDLKGNTIYNGGLALNYGEGLFSVYVPLFSSSNLSDIYASENTGFLGKITFRLDLNRFNPWEIVEDFNQISF